jgi:hypothetical protein
LKTREEERKAQQAGFLRQMGDRARRSVQWERELGLLPPALTSDDSE